MNSIGLARSTVKLEPHNSYWDKVYQIEAQSLKDKLGSKAKDIQHVGSTAIPELVAKPIIDVAILVDNLDIAEQWVKPLTELGYWYKGKQNDMPDRRFFAKGPESKRTVYLHVVNQDEYDRMIKFRDSLRSAPKLAKEYSALKQKLVKTLSQNREKYTSSKNDFIQKVIR